MVKLKRQKQPILEISRYLLNEIQMDSSSGSIYFFAVPLIWSFRSERSKLFHHQLKGMEGQGDANGTFDDDLRPEDGIDFVNLGGQKLEIFLSSTPPYNEGRGNQFQKQFKLYRNRQP